MIVKKKKTDYNFLDISFWVLVYSKIFFWCNRPFPSRKNPTTKLFHIDFLSRVFQEFFFFEKKRKNVEKPEKTGVCREAFYLILLELYNSILRKLMNSDGSIHQETVSKKKNFRLGIETSPLNGKGIQCLVSYLNRFYTKKNKHACLTDFYNLFLRNFLSPFKLPNFSGFSLFLGASSLFFEKTFQKTNKVFFSWEKKFNYPNFLVFNQVVKEGVVRFFHTLEFYPKFSKDPVFTKKIARYLESVFTLESNFLKCFLLKNSNNFSDYLAQKERLAGATYWQHFVFAFFEKNLEDFNEKFFLTFFKFFFGEKGIQCSFILFLFVSDKLFTERRLKNSLIDFSIFHNFLFSFQNEQLFFEFPQYLFQHKRNLFEAFYKLDFLQNLDFLDSSLVKFRVLFFMGVESFIFMKEGELQIKKLEKIPIEDHLFNLKEIGLYSFLFFVIFSARSLCMAQLTEKVNLENKVSKYLFSLEDRIIGKGLNFFEQKFVVNKIASLNEIIGILFNQKTLSEIQLSYFDTRYRIGLSDIFNQHFLNLSDFEIIKKISTQTVLNNFQFKGQRKISQNINSDFIQNLKNWSNLIRSPGKNKQWNQDYYFDLLSCLIIKTKVNLNDNKQALKIEKNVKFFPVSIFRCLRFFSRFFFLKMLKEKQLIWNFSQTRILLESSGLFCRNNFCLLIQVDFSDLIFLLAFNKMQIIIEEDLKSFFPQKQMQLSERARNLKKAGLIEEKFDKHFMRKFFVLEKNFFPVTKLIKIFTFFELSFLFEQKNLVSKQLNDHIYVSEATIVKILKFQTKTKIEKLLREVRKRLKNLFSPDIRGILLQTRVLCDKGYIQYIKKENSYQYFSE